MYAPAPHGLREEKTDEGTAWTGPTNQYSNDGTIPMGVPMNSNDNQSTASAITPKSPTVEQGTFNNTTLGHGIHIVQQGWMMKEGGLVKSWKRRYFVLKTNKVLNYYESDNSSMVKGNVTLSEVVSVQKKQKKSFSLVTQKRTWNFACASTEVRDKWVDNIANVAGL